MESVSPNNHSLIVYYLEDNCHSSVLWLSSLKDALKSVCAGIEFIHLDKHHLDQAFWQGRPFIIVGRQILLTRYLLQQYEEIPEMLSDHAYFWCLSDIAQEDLSDQTIDICNWREVVLHWDQQNQNVIVAFLRDLYMHHPMVGLSTAGYRLRSEISRLSKGHHGPWTPTLILGESGVGKEMAANAIFQASSREKKNKFTAVACAWLTENLLQDQLFGHKKGAYADAYEDRPGLLETYSDGAVLFDDFDTAPPGVQGALLRIMSTARGQAARFSRLGETSERKTTVWLMFATNADIASLMQEKKWREDFIYRFEDRVLHVAPLRERIADIPALAQTIWHECNEGSDKHRELSYKVVRWLCGLKLPFNGNVRSLRALLSLVASMAKQPVHNSQTIRTLMQQVLDRGPEYHHWVGIITSPVFTTAIEPKNSRVCRILELDNGFMCNGSGKDGQSPVWASQESPPSELEAKEILLKMESQRPGIVETFAKSVTRLKARGDKIRPAVRLSRILVYLEQYQQIDKKTCTQLTGTKDATVAEDLKILEQMRLVQRDKEARKDVWRISVQKTPTVQPC
ncbi:MAG: sigma 54-interacting transcriptional regulator [Gammaproteobacteria bacterium]|nr:sigma 54-interacting transcriptional regulator [Gammaproteobacteria bacterium]MDH5800350.1 sigma 54-interacting transcriptional regulator [Gammaproteobacteria bacterium]